MTDLSDFKRLVHEPTERALQAKVAALQARVERLEAALADAIWAADYLAGQQAMPDDGYKARLEDARAVLVWQLNLGPQTAVVGDEPKETNG